MVGTHKMVLQLRLRCTCRMELMKHVLPVFFRPGTVSKVGPVPCIVTVHLLKRSRHREEGED